MLRFIEIALGESGSPRCRRCHSVPAQRLRGASDVLRDVSEAVRCWDRGPGPNLAFGGAEPFHHPEILAMVVSAAELGARRIRLDSDAHALTSHQTARAVVQAGVRQLQVGLAGSEAGLHDSLFGGPSAFADTIAGVAAFREAAKESEVRVHVSARVPVCRHNLEDLPAIVTTAAKAGISAVRLTVEDEMLNVWTAAPWIEAACDTGIVYATWVEVEGVPFGPAQGWELHLASVYRSVVGKKAVACTACPLDAVCGGATAEAGESVVRNFQVPPDADATAASISKGFNPPSGHHG